jgi:hypothetical protein
VGLGSCPHSFGITLFVFFPGGPQRRDRLSPGGPGGAVGGHGGAGAGLAGSRLYVPDGMLLWRNEEARNGGFAAGD